MRILGPPSADYDTVYGNLVRMQAEDPERIHDRFIDEMFPALWAASKRYSVDGVGVVAQAMKETGGGTFKRLVPPNFYNTAGLKLRHPNKDLGTAGEVTLAHSQFVSWEHGAEAHVQHLLAYAGVLDLGSYLVVDPRWPFVVGKYQVETFEELSGKWATPGPTYGQDLVALAEELMTAV